VGFELAYRFREATAMAWFLGRKKDAARAIDSIASRIPLVNTPPAMEAAPGQIVLGYTMADRPDKARAFFEKWTSALDSAQRRLRTVPIRMSQARIAAAEEKYDLAIREFLAADTAWDGYPTACATCTLPELGYAYDLAGRHDQAIATFERYLASPANQRWSNTDPIYLAGIYKRLGELYEEKNDLAKAASYYAKFIDLWTDADPELQPRVAEAKARLARVRKREAR
jgi:tetratricopeptide (TPR) repeat protein